MSEVVADRQGFLAGDVIRHSFQELLGVAATLGACLENQPNARGKDRADRNARPRISFCILFIAQLSCSIRYDVLSFSLVW